MERLKSMTPITALQSVAISEDQATTSPSDHTAIQNQVASKQGECSENPQVDSVKRIRFNQPKFITNKTTELEMAEKDSVKRD